MERLEKIKTIRQLKNWTQEDVADKLDISTHAYAKIERGETDVNLSRLRQIAEVMEIDLPLLFGLDENTVFNVSGVHNSPSTEQTEYKHELEKAHLMIEQRDKEIDYLKQQNSDLREIINILKKPEKPSET